MATFLLGRPSLIYPRCLSSPTRKEVDRAHANGDWVDIGILSVRNIAGRVSGKRTTVWCILLATSLPIHLIYNSVVRAVHSYGA